AGAARRTASMFAASESTLDVATVVEEPLRVNGDAAALEELFTNLLLNAAQSLGAGGRTRVSTGSDNGTVVVTVSDNGRGIAAEDLDRVLEPFYTTRPGGTGLGLPIARQLAVAHGGDLRVESAVGVGTTVTIRLPRARPPVPDALTSE